MSFGKWTFIGIFIFCGCSKMNSDDQIEGHWHCIKSGGCEFETIDIQDSTLVSNKYSIGSYSHFLEINQNFKFYITRDELVINYDDTLFHYQRSDLKICLLSDRYRKSVIDLSLPEVEFAKPFDVSKSPTTGDLIIGKLRRGIDDTYDKLAIQYQDSIFIQVNDVLINYKDIPGYLLELKSCMDCPREKINLHADKEVPEGVIGTIISLINPYGYRSTAIYNVVKIKNGDIGLLRR